MFGRFWENFAEIFLPEKVADHCLLFLERYVLNVEVDFGLLLEGHGVLAEPLEGLDHFLIVVDLPVLQVDVLGSKNAV